MTSARRFVLWSVVGGLSGLPQTAVAATPGLPRAAAEAMWQPGRVATVPASARQILEPLLSGTHDGCEFVDAALAQNTITAQLLCPNGRWKWQWTLQPWLAPEHWPAEWQLVGPAGVTSTLTRWPTWSQRWQTWRAAATWHYVLPNAPGPLAGKLGEVLEHLLRGQPNKAAVLLQASLADIAATSVDECVDLGVLAVLAGSEEAKTQAGRCLSAPGPLLRERTPLALALAGDCTAAAAAVGPGDSRAWPVSRLCAAHHAWAAVGLVADRQAIDNQGAMPDWQEVAVLAALGRCDPEQALGRLRRIQRPRPALWAAIALAWADEGQVARAIQLLTEAPQLTDTDVQLLRTWIGRLVRPAVRQPVASPCEAIPGSEPPTPTGAQGDPRQRDAAPWLVLAAQLPRTAGSDLARALAAATLGQPEAAEAALAGLPAALRRLLQVQLIDMEVAALRDQTAHARQLANTLLQRDSNLLEAHWQLAKLTAKSDTDAAIHQLRLYLAVVQARPDLAWQLPLVQEYLRELEDDAAARRVAAQDEAADVGVATTSSAIDLNLPLAPLAALAVVVVVPAVLWWRRRRTSRSQADSGPQP